MPPHPSFSLRDAWRRRWAAGLVGAVAFGIVFRLIWLDDIEFKGDEAWTVAQVQGFAATGAAPLLGMPSSAGVPNAGLSLWIFLAIGRAIAAADPLSLSRAVQLLNIAALLLLLGFALRIVPRGEREPWLWSAALVAVNPLEVLFQRKLWPPSVFPLFTLAFLFGWWRRERWWGAFLWGLLGALLGQIQLGGWLFAAAFVLVTVIFARRGVRWLAWLAGSLIGVLPMLPWLAAVLAQGGAAGGMRVPSPAFFGDWLGLALGTDLGYSLGGNLGDFLAGPVIGGEASHLALGLVGVILALFAALLFRWGRRLAESPRRGLAAFFDPDSPTALALDAALWGYGILVTLAMRPIYLHYLIIVFALPGLSLAWLAWAGGGEDQRSLAWARRLLGGLVLAQALLTAAFLGYIHETRVIAGDYGTVYGAQPHPGALAPAAPH